MRGVWGGQPGRQSSRAARRDTHWHQPQISPPHPYLRTRSMSVNNAVCKIAIPSDTPRLLSEWSCPSFETGALVRQGSAARYKSTDGGARVAQVARQLVRQTATPPLSRLGSCSFTSPVSRLELHTGG